MSKLNRILEELPESLIEHVEYHGQEFETVMITFAEDGTWFLTGFGDKAFHSMRTVSKVLDEASELVGDDKETLH